MQTITRRSFIAAALASLSTMLVMPAPARARMRRRTDPTHPDPRPGITGEKVATKAQLASTPALIPLFDSIREIPEIADGIRCHCGCADLPGHRSLLTCYEGDAMARECSVCQGQGRLAVRLRKSGKSLDEIRAAIDAKFG